MKRVLMALALVGLMGGAAYADEFDLTGGVLILHAPPGAEYTASVDWCTYDLGLADCCLDQDNSLEYTATYDVWYIVSNFYESKSFNAIEFGINYDPAVYMYAQGGICSDYLYDTIEYPSAGSWPADGSAIATALRSGNWTGTCVPTHYIWGYYYGYCTPEPCDPPTGMITLGVNPATNNIGWIADGPYAPDCVGQMGLGIPGVSCCSEVACCLPDGSCIDVTDVADCDAVSGVIYPANNCDDVGFECPQPPEPMACCLPDGSCVDVLELAECDALSGVLYPDNYCDEPGFECPVQPEPAACCFPDGSCVMMLEAACIDAGGTFYAQEDCATFECPIELMACCLLDGTCVDVLELAECDALSGVLYPDNYCDEPGFECPQPPPEFACCFDFDEACYMMTADACAAAGGVWYDGMVCESAGGDFNCPLWRVCCIGEDCTITTEAGCAGEWHPEWDSCGPPNPCEEPVPNEPNSWGSIKSIYR